LEPPSNALLLQLGLGWAGKAASTSGRRLAQLDIAVPWVEESYKRIKQAIADNELTGWYACVAAEGTAGEDEA